MTLQTIRSRIGDVRRHIFNGEYDRATNERTSILEDFVKAVAMLTPSTQSKALAIMSELLTIDIPRDK